MENKLSIWELCMIFGVVAIILAGFMSVVSASPSESESDKNNYESIYIKSSNKDDADISSVYKAKSILQIRDIKSNLTGAQKKLSTDLLQLLDSTFLPYGQDRETLEIQMKHLGQFRPASSVSPVTDGMVADDMVYVYVHLKPSAETGTIEPYVWEVTERDEENHLAVAWVEVNDLETLASQEEVRTIRTVMPPLLRTGSVITEGDAIHRTYDVRTTYSQSGSGVKVGIISDGVDHWTDARNSGDLPAELTVLSNAQGGDEGTAMLEIVHDMVPDAELYFHDHGANWVAFNDAIDALVGAGCDVVCDDIGWITQPFFEDGIIATHLTIVLASNDIIYASSAGNAGQKHYQGDYYNDSDQFHDFSGGTEPVYKCLYINIPQNGGVTVVLQWNDEFGSSGNNYDLLLYDMSDWSVLASSMYMQDGDDDPIEEFSYTNTAGYSITAEIDVWDYFGHAETKTLEVFVYPNNGAYVYANNIDPADSIFGHPAVPGVIAAGAIDASDPGNDDIEPFSSRGPVTITYPSPVSRPKPDLCGVDGVAVTGAGGFGYWDGSNYRFYGTSAAAPHIAAIAAQMWGACPSKTGDEIGTVLCDSAVDLGSAGYDNIYGYGMTDALAVFVALDCGIAPPNITSSAPPSPVSDTEGSSRTFGIVVNQTVNVNWYINSTQVQTNTSVAEVSYTNTSAEVGVWNVSAVASNANGTAMRKWVWNVTVAPQTFPCTCGDICVNEAGWWRDGGVLNASDTPIQAAATNATAGDRIYVYNGSYTENVNIGTPYLTLAGEGADVVTVNAISTSDYVFEVTAEYVNISGFNVSGATGDYKAGIYVTSDKCNISNNIATYNYYGIYLYESSNNTLTYNIANSNTYYGILLYFSSNNTFTNNTASNNECGIYLYESSNNTLSNNTASNNECGIYMYDSSNNNTLTKNTVSDNRWDIYIEDSSSTFTDNTVNGTTVSFTYGGNVSLKGEGSPAADPSGRHSIGKFINATNQSADAWLYLNFSYSTADISGLDESSLAVWKYNGTTWLEDGWNGARYLSTANNVVGVNITTFSVFAPMAPAVAGLPCDCGDICVNTSAWWCDGGVLNASDMPIQAAVTNANAGERIYVWNGSYTENVNIGTPYLTLAGEGADVVTVNAISTSDYVFEVTADCVNISGFNVIGATGDYKAGIYVTSDKCNISNNIATYNYYGIYLYESSNNTLTDSIANSNTNYGILLYDSSNNNTLTNNTANSNNDSGICLSESNSNTIASNSVNSNYVDGIFLGNSSDNIIAGNIVNENNDCGISLLLSNYNNITENNVSNNYNGGIPLTSSHNNQIYHNNLINNSWNAFDDTGTNSWHSGYMGGGNYWSDYTGIDANGDGIGDTPYSIDGSAGAQDNYPFMNMNGWVHETSLLFAITPNSRIAQIGTPVTIFLSVINSGTSTATGVSISQASGLTATISYQPWDGAALTGSPDTPVDIPAGEASHFVLTINATAEFDSSPMTFYVSGTNAASAPVSSVNTLTISSSAVPYADIIMMSTSLDVSTAVNTPAAFAIATSNVGSAEATGVSLIVDVPSTITGLVCQVNETNPDGTIKGPAAGLTIPIGGQPTFAVFLIPTQAIDYDPANNRIMLKLVDGSGKVVGAQSVAVSTA